VTVERATLAPSYTISRLIRGGWQLTGDHGPVDRARALDDMAAFIDAGVTTFDGADIYTGVEEFYGEARARLRSAKGAAAADAMRVHTKFVPDWDVLPRIDAAYVRGIIDRSLARLRVERLDLVQFHWWNYAIDRHVEVALMLEALRREGKIALIGGTNFDTAHTAAMIEAGVPVASMQVQYSPLDLRPENGLTALCAATGMKLLCYGTLAGGFLTRRWLGAAEPEDLSFNRSLVKYKLIIDDLGGWDLFQALLETFDRIGARHGVSIACVSGRWTLDRPHVAGIIVGARYAAHLQDSLGLFRFALDDADRAAIDAVLAQRTGPLGDTYALERDKDGRHGRIMKYNLNKTPA